MVRVLFLLLLSFFCFAQPSNSGNVYTSKTNIFTKSQTIDVSASNFQPSTTRHMTLKNSGTYTWIDFLFGASYKAAIGADNNGNLNFHYDSGRCTNFNRGISSYSPDAQLCGYGFVHNYGYAGFVAGINAGSTGSPSSTLENQGTLENKTELITSTGVLNTSATNLLCDASTNSCTGTPTRSCSYWTNSTDCGLRNSHGGCNWFSGYSCSSFNYEYGMSSCGSQSGCSASTTTCSGAGDQYTCESQDDSYGGDCVWNSSSTDCNIYNSDQMSCESNSSYCTWNPASFSDCSSFNGDQSTCEAYSGCSWDYNDSYSCLGTYETSSSYCSGTIESYSCDGTYYTGECTGSYGAVCQGTSTCSGLTNSSDCGNEAGCSWSTTLSLILPSLNSSQNGREYRIKNIATSGADCIITGNTGQDIDGASTKTLANYKDSATIVYHELTASCSSLSEGDCGSQSGCSANYPSCFWDSENNSCNGGGSCSGYSDESSCNSQNYYDGCLGTYTTAKRWHQMD